MTDPVYQYDFQIGSTIEGMANVESLGTGGVLQPTAPKAPFSQYSAYSVLGDNTTLGRGLPWCEWLWGIIDDLSLIHI